jgi:hypothetical protein
MKSIVIMAAAAAVSALKIGVLSDAHMNKYYNSKSSG